MKDYNELDDNISPAKKTEEYFKKKIDHYIRRADYFGAYRSDLQILYNASVGIIDDESYKYVLNPLNTKNDKLKRFPARLRNYPIIEPVVEMFLGEFATRDDDPTVINLAMGDNSFTRERLNFMRRILAQNFVNALNDAGFDTGVESEEVPNPKEAFESFEKTYGNAKASLGAKALAILRQDLLMDEKIQHAAWHWLVSGYVVTFKDVVENDVQYIVADPRDVTFFGIPEGGVGEDAEAVVYERKMTESQINARFNLTDKEIAKLEAEDHDIPTDRYSLREMYDETIDVVTGEGRKDYEYNRDQGFSVYFVVWKGYKKQGALKYIDSITGQETEITVDEDYKLDKKKGDISIEWITTEVWYQGHRIEDMFYKDIKEGVVQRNELNNTKTCKLPFNGKFRGYTPGVVNSIVKIGLNFQVLYNILHYRFELTVAKSKAKMLAFPFGLIPRQHGWDEERWFYWSDANQVAFYDESQPGAAVAIQGIKEIDMSLGKYVQEMWSLIQEVKQEWWDVIGLNRQRYGNTMASDGKGTSEQALMRSAIITEEMFRQFDEIIERDYNGLIDYAKVAWIDGKRGWYITNDKYRVFVEIDGVEFMNSQYAVYVSNSRTDKEKLKEAKNLLLTMGQNGLGPDGLLGVLDASSMSNAKEIASKAMDIQRQHEMGVAQQNKEAEEVKANADMQKAQMESADKRYVADTNYQATVKSAAIKANVDLLSLMQDTVEGEQGVDFDKVDTLQAVKSQIADEVKNIDYARKQEEASLKREQMATSLAVAKENKNRYD